MFYYTAETVGEGTQENPFRANYEDTYIYWGENPCPTCNRCLIATPNQVIDLRLISVLDLKDACESRGLNLDEVTLCFVGDK